MRNVADKSVPRLLTDEQRERRLQAYFELQNKLKEDLDTDCPPPYSPNLTACDFFLFPRLKRDMKLKHFTTAEEVKQKSLEGIKNILISEFNNCFEQ